MSVNDDLPSLRNSEALICEACDTGKPVIGHCLGGQLIASALDARVAVADSPEIGWSKIKLGDGPAARDWFGQFAGNERDVLQWHYDAFSLPEPRCSPATTHFQFRRSRFKTCSQCSFT